MADNLTTLKFIATIVVLFVVLVGGLYAGYSSLSENSQISMPGIAREASNASPQLNQTLNESRTNRNNETTSTSEPGVDDGTIPADEPSNQTDTDDRTVYTARFEDLTRTGENITGSIRIGSDVDLSERNGSLNLTIRSTDSEQQASKTYKVSEEATRFKFQELPEQALIVEGMFSWNKTRYNFVSTELE